MLIPGAIDLLFERLVLRAGCNHRTKAIRKLPIRAKRGHQPIKNRGIARAGNSACLISGDHAIHERF
ncbi:hypothetical protein LK12_17495 [Novosphingobium malaysiense]|uniref:Uncharacterized protein n=1 Tax=Novosphingobium malaysiense TaxID=1348853 RepID=A0A0B1ZM77_9SPHN|nr:hypothetical protein LK12_17495 [Novosphingobium malaysiense]